MHGDLKRLVKVLRSAKLVSALPSAPDQVKWTGGKSVLVILGDLIDKWHKSKEVIALLRKLQRDAESNGGQIIILMGNHEAEFLAFPKNKKLAEKQQDRKRTFFHQLKDPTEVANCKNDLGQFLCNLPIAVRVNDWFFSHGGNTKNRTIEELSAAIKDGVNSKLGFASKELTGDDDSILEARLRPKPWFYPHPKRSLNEYVEKLGVRHLVQGHQPGPVEFDDEIERERNTFFQRYGLLFLIDSGMSRGNKNKKRATVLGAPYAFGMETMPWSFAPMVRGRRCGMRARFPTIKQCAAQKNP